MHRRSTQSFIGQFRLWSLLFLFGLAVNIAFGQAYDIRKFGEEQGLHQPYIYSMVQDKDGFLWLGAGNGLVRYDGMNFLHFTEKDGIAPDFVTQNLVDTKGRIWFGHNSGGLTVLENGKFRVFPLPETIVSTIAGIVEDENQQIWVCSQRNGLARIDAAGGVKLWEDAFRGMFIFSMQRSADGSILLGTSEGIQVFKVNPNSGPELQYTVSETELTKIEKITPKRDGKGFWVGTEDMGFLFFEPGQGDQYSLQQFSKTQGVDIARVPEIFEDLEGNIWVGTSGNGFKKYGHTQTAPGELREIVPFHQADSIWMADIVSSIYQDRFGQIWLGTYGNGLIRMVEEMFVLYQPTAEQIFDNIYSVIEDRTGNLWFGTDNGLYVVNSKKIQDHGFHFTASNGMPLVTEKYFGTAQGLPKDIITTLFQDVKGTIWVGTSTKGVFQLDPETEKIDSFFISDLSLSRCINAIQGDAKGNIWVGTRGGVYVYHPDTGEKEYFNTRNNISHNNIYDIYPDSKKQVWIASHSNRVSIYDGNAFTIFPQNSEIGIPNIFNITEDKTGAVWLATDGGGVFRFRSETDYDIFNKESGLVSNYCYLILNDRENNIWIAHRDGLSRFILKTGMVLPFQGGVEFPLKETTMNAAFLDNEGNIWFGTQHGAIKYNNFYDRFEAVEPKVFITQIENLETKDTLAEGAEMEYGKSRIRISYLGLTFVNQEDVRYQYRLNDLNWSEVTAQTSVTFEGLAEGEYVFQVKAMNKQGLWSEASAEYRFVIAPPFWKTWWFRLLGLLVVAGLLIGYVQYRTFVLNKEKQLLESKVKERTAELESEKQKVEVANRELEKLSLVASETDNAVYILDADGYLIWVNQGFTRMTGITYDELTAMRKGKTFFETSTNPQIVEMMATVKRERTSAAYESTLPTKDGGTIYVQSTLNAIFDDSGEIRNLVIIDSNITEQKLAELKIQQMNSELEEKVAERTAQLAEANTELEVEKEELKRTAELLQQTNLELDTFIYRASHDLKGPLATLVGLAEIASMEVTDPTAKTYLDLLQKSASKLDGVLLDLLEATKVKQATIAPKPLNLKTITEQAIKEASGKCNPGATQFITHFPEQVEIVNDTTILNAILYNLILNALQYRDDAKEPLVTIDIAQKAHGMLQISVTDNGTGIAEKIKSKMFNMFFRGTEKSTGSGLGLYTVRIAANKIGGRAWMTSQEGIGSTFYVEIPANIG